MSSFSDPIHARHRSVDLRHQPKALAALKSFNAHAGEICLSAITLAELLHGVEKSANPTTARRRVDNFVSRLSVLEYGERAAHHYGEIKSDLERRGQVR